jgi:cytochrome P450
VTHSDSAGSDARPAAPGPAADPRPAPPAATPEDRLDLATLGPDFLADPYPFLAAFRVGQPVRRVVYHGVPAWLVTRFADAQAVYSEPRLGADVILAPPQVRAVPWITASDMIGLGRSMVRVDPPAHTRLRRLVSRAFTPRRVEDLRPFTRQATAGLLRQAVQRGRADIISDFAVPLTSQVIMKLLGVPPTDIPAFQDHTAVFLSTDPADQARFPQALAWVRGYIDTMVAAKRTDPGDDLLSALIAAQDGGERLAGAELGSMMLLLLMAGFETTASLIGNGTLLLITHPDQRAVLQAEPGLIPGAIEEMLRFEGAALASLPRYASQDLTIGGVRIRRGEVVIVSWPAANRDPARFPDPDRFDVRRGDAGHLGFAYGPRYCLGAPLARMEAATAFEALLRCPRLGLAVPRQELRWRITPNIRGLKALPVTFG